MQLYINNAAQVAAANDLLYRYGPLAGEEAALRAAGSRARGNVAHFCSWRQVERLIALLNASAATGTVH